MGDTDQKREDEVLRRMLRTPPKPHKASGDPKTRSAPELVERRE